MKWRAKTPIFGGTNNIYNFINFLSVGKYSTVIILVDENTRKYCLPVIKDFLGVHSIITIKSGENNKTINTCITVWEQLLEVKIDRKALLINLGGGVICDMGGFIAATYKRGIDFIHIPTTLLAMSDACLGGKLAVDINGNKNQVGLFKYPKAILIYPNFLKTLPKRHLLCGYAEIIKHAIIGDKFFFKAISSQPLLSKDFDMLIMHSLKIKTRFVKMDFLENGIRKSLNFGHSIGHALETYSLNNDGDNYIYHGEAVAAGMIAESYISYKRKLISISELEQINRLILNHFSKVKILKKNYNKIVSLISQDKKNEDNRKLFTLLEGIGNVRLNETVNDEEIKESLEYYNKL
jgi:3-dehydroquinate synthase